MNVIVISIGHVATVYYYFSTVTVLWYLYNGNLLLPDQVIAMERMTTIEYIR